MLSIQERTMKNKTQVLCVNKILFYYRYEWNLDFKRRCEREEKLGGSGSRRNLEGNLPAVTPSCRGFVAVYFTSAYLLCYCRPNHGVSKEDSTRG